MGQGREKWGPIEKWGTKWGKEKSGARKVGYKVGQQKWDKEKSEAGKSGAKKNWGKEKSVANRKVRR